MSLKSVTIVGACIAGAWSYLLYQSWLMNHLPMSQMWMPPARLTAWPLTELFGVFSMWAIMMAAMMLPSILPMLNAFSRYSQRDPQASHWQSLWFGSGYLAIWIGFSVLLTAMQWLFHGLAWLSPMMESNQPTVTATLFILAGIYQFSAFKNACLRHCRTPFGYLLNQWRPGKTGALWMGLNHGMNCLGCCWAQMLIMFAVGVMNITSMLLITLLILAEKAAPINPKTLSYTSGLIFLLCGGYGLLVRQ